MGSEFKLIEDVNPSKTPLRIKEKFAKLTLTSNKKTAASTTSKKTSVKKTDCGDNSDSEDQQRRTKIQSEKMVRVSRSLLKDLLTDDESENESNELNRLFLSRMPQKPDAIQNHRTSNSMNQRQREGENSIPFTDKLEISDSDVTNCSEYESTSSSLTNMRDKNLEASISQETEMERLQVSTDYDEDSQQKSSENLFATKQDNNKEEFDILSLKVTQLGIKSPTANTKIDTKEFHLSEKKRIAEADTLSMSTNQRISTESNDVHINGLKSKDIPILCPVTPTRSHKSPGHRISTKNKDHDSIYTISSNNSSSVPNESLSISGTDESSDVVVISDTSAESSINMQISDVKPKRYNEKLSLPSTVDNTKDERLQEFLDNIPPVQPGIECLSHEESGSISKGSYDLLPKVQRFHGNLKNENETYIEDSVEISETSHENDDDAKTETAPQSQTKTDKNQIPSKTSPSKSESQISISHSTPCIEKINISAKIKIQVHIKEPTIIYSTDSPENKNTNDENNDEECEKASEKSLSQSEQKTEKNNYNENEDTSEEDQYQAEFVESEKNTPQNRFTTINLDDDSDDVQIDEVAKNILTKLYGNKWQTPEIIQKLDKSLSFTNSKKKEDESTLSNFSRFGRNILPDLQSTKLRQTAFMNEISEEFNNFKKPVPVAEVKPIKNEFEINEEKENDESFEIKKPNRDVRNKVKQRRAYRIEDGGSDNKSSSENASDEDFTGESDTSWKAKKKSSPSLDSSSSSSSPPPTTSKKRQKNKKEG